eukprot:TRINITY_DN6546_c0_g1_i4.p1 TRINITY_DN6546_c0_g1~~TRINITY_DN6546_c0_g1_i4.p1  ORF type:complete len:350 (-),score=82.83 TRINITY_DN6546_c0_g1_i4:32-1030(-)
MTLPNEPRQSTNTVLMVAPTQFCLNKDAAEDNHFMTATGLTPETITKKALDEFDGLVSVLRSHGVDVNVFTHEAADEADFTPDAVFPNNWFSTHRAPETGVRTLVLYPMKVPNRQRERRPELIADIEGKSEGAGVVQGSLTASNPGFGAKIDLTHLEEQGVFLEGTGSMVIDRVNRVVYACTSERTHIKALEEWASAVGYPNVVTFSSTDSNGLPVYHTNVVMAIGTGWAVVCADSVANQTERDRLLSSLSRHHEVVTITHGQVSSFCGNILELRDGHDRPVIAMSTQAYNGFTDAQKSVLLKHAHDLVHAAIPVIETVGGGGVRCSLAEIF